MNILPQILMNGLIASSVYGLIALGFNIIYGTVKFFDLAYGVTLVLGGYGMLYFGKSLGLPIYISIIISLLICGVFGYLCYRLVYSKLAKRKATNMIYLVASLGIFTVVQAIIAILFTSQFQTITTKIGGIVRLGSVVVTNIQITTIFLFVLISIFCGVLFKFTRLGKAIRAVSDDAEVSSIIGIPTQKIIGLVFLLGSIVGGVAGIMVAYDSGVEPTMGFSLILKGVIAAIIGGVGNIWGGIFGALMLGMIENLGIWKFSAEWKDIIAFGVLILFLIFRPQGVFKK